jgi:NADH:ubiquinone oxidoreductase subunit E
MITIKSLPEYSKIEGIVKKYGKERKNLLPILHEIQSEENSISSNAQQIVADLMSIHPVEVFSVISFFHFLDESPKAENVVRLCKSISCFLAGKDKIKQTIKDELGIETGERTSDGKIYFEEINCFGLCDVGPAITVNEQVFTKMDAEKTKNLIRKLMEK